MSTTPVRSKSLLLLAVSALLVGGTALGQDQSDRPPWARKPKSAAGASSTSKASTTASTAAPASAPDGEPGKIVQPTAPIPADESGSTSILLMFLSAFSTTRTGLRRTFPKRPSNCLKKAWSKRSTNLSQK